MRRAAALLAAALALTAVSAARGQGGSDLPASLQAALLKKVFLFDAQLVARKGFSILVVHPPGEEGEDAAREIAAAFRAVDLAAEAASQDRASEHLPQAAVVYFAADSDEDDLREACRRQRCLSVSGSTALAEAGRVAVAVGLDAGGTPEIVVHRGRLAEEGHELPARVLQLARVVS